MPPPPKGASSHPPRVLQVVASLRWTVALFALAMVVIFLGTLAQTRYGVWRVIDEYFRSFVAWVDLGLMLPVGGLPDG